MTGVQTCALPICFPVTIAGDEKSVVGYGLGKANEVTDAITKGIDDAKKNLVKVSVLKGTVPHPENGKFGGSRVFIKPAAHGTGVIAGGAADGNVFGYQEAWAEYRYKPSQISGCSGLMPLARFMLGIFRKILARCQRWVLPSLRIIRR